MAELLDRAKKVLFPEATTPEGKSRMIAKEKRRGRAATNSCSLLATSDDGTLSISDITRDKENRVPRKKNQAMDTLAVGSSKTQNIGEAGTQKRRGFRKRDKRGSLESRSSRSFVVSDSLAALGENSDGLESQSNVSIVPSMNESKGRRHRGRCNHPVSSLEQTGSVATNAKSRTEVNRKTAISSLMNLPSSTQKPTAAKSEKKQQNELELISNIQSMNLNDTSRNNQTFSSPIVYKHRAFSIAGECTSPPDILYRLSSVSNNIFSRSPRMFSPSKATPTSSRPSRKRLDKKKTPDKFIGMEECGLLNADGVPMEKSAPSPMVAELGISPKIGGRQRRSEKLNNPEKQQQEREIVSEKWNDCNVSFDCDGADNIMMSPDAHESALVTSPLVDTHNPLPKAGEDEFICAKVNLFPAAIDSEAASITHAPDNNRGSLVVDVEIATPRAADKSTQSMEYSDANTTKNGFIRGSAVFSVHKAPPMPKPSLAELGSKNQTTKDPGGKKKNTKAKNKKAPAPASLNDPPAPRASKAKSPAKEGIRRSARESKVTDRLTVSWNDSEKRTFRFTNNNTFSSSDESEGESDAKPLVHLLVDEKTNINAPGGNPKSMQAKRVAHTKLSPPTSLEDGQWSNEETSILRHAQSTVDPTLTNYWEEVAALVGKSATDCQQKWFSMVATPRGRPMKENKIQQQQRPTANDHDAGEDSCDDEDDLFQSTPMREALIEVQNDALSRNLNQSSLFGKSFDLSPCLQAAAAYQPPGTTSLNDRRTGYKTYIDKLRKDLNPSQPKTKKVAQHKALKGYTTAHLESGGWGKMMADGSLKLTIQEESEDEDDFFDEEDEE